MNLTDNQNIETLEKEDKSKKEAIIKKDIEVKNNNHKKEEITMETYLKLEDNIGVLEVDLVLMREKGSVIKFLDLTFSGINPENNQQQTAKKVIESKEDFETLKTFINQLDWEKL